MGFLSSLLGALSGATANKALSPPKSGPETCWWDHPQVFPLGAGRGFTTDIVGESYWQDNIGRIVGGKCEKGYKSEVVAQLVFEDNPHDPNAVAVMIDTRPVGWIPRHEAAEFRKEMLAVNPERQAMTCKAKIVGGWDDGEGNEGSFGVKLSLARPLKLEARRAAQKRNQ